MYTRTLMASPGVYLFTRKGHPVYVGRSDTDVEFRMGQSFRQGRYDLTMTWYETTSARQAYLKECRLFHRHAPWTTQITLPSPQEPTGAAQSADVLGRSPQIPLLSAPRYAITQTNIYTCHKLSVPGVGGVLNASSVARVAPS